MLNVKAHYPKTAGFEDLKASWASFDEKVPQHLGNLEKLLASSANGGETFASAITAGDLAVYAAINLILDNKADALAAFPLLTAFYAKVGREPGPAKVAAMGIKQYFGLGDGARPAA